MPLNLHRVTAIANYLAIIYPTKHYELQESIWTISAMHLTPVCLRKKQKCTRLASRAPKGSNDRFEPVVVRVPITFKRAL